MRGERYFFTYSLAMKRIFHTCVAAFAAACVLPAADDAAVDSVVDSQAPAAAEAADAEPAAGEDAAVEKGPIEAMREKMAKIDKAYSELEKPTRILSEKYTRMTGDVQEAIKKLEGLQSQLDELETKLKNSSEDFEFSVVPTDERYKYETEGNELVKKVIDNLSSKNENKLIEGLQLFEGLRANYQGVPRYAEAAELYQRVIAKFEKKWSSLLESVKRDRQKMRTTNKDQLAESEKRQYERLEKKMESEHRDIEEDWFLPKPTDNMLMLDKAMSRVRRAKNSISTRSADTQANVPELLHKFWDNMDAVKELMVNGKLEEAEDKLKEDDSLRSLSSLSRTQLPDNIRNDLRKQFQALSDELRNRQSSLRKMNTELNSTKSAFERQARSLDTRMDRLSDDLQFAREEEIRRAEEAAARAAELKAEQERAAAEAAAEAEEDAADAPQKPKKNKKSKKKQAEGEDKKPEDAGKKAEGDA